MKSVEEIHELPDEKNVIIDARAAVKGLVMGVARVYSKGNINIDSDPVDAGMVDDEKMKFNHARKRVGVEMGRLSEFAKNRDDAETSDIIHAQYQILQDPELGDTVSDLIENKRYRAEKAIYDAFQGYIDLIKSSQGTFLESRLADLRDVRDRLIHNTQQLAVIASFGKNTVIVAEEVSPLEVVNFARNGVKGIICNAGGLTSHASIIANAMGIPMVIDTKSATRIVRDGDTVILDGCDQQVIVRPDEETSGAYMRAIKRHKEEEKLLRIVIDQPCETFCGKKISLQANIDFEDEVLNIEKYRAEGIGLLRTDTLLLNSGLVTMDSKRQIEFFQSAFAASGSAPVTIRLLDVGGDKVLDHQSRESNPFLGWRGVRILLDRRELLRSQLMAITRVAGQYPGRTRVLVPMVATIDEFREVKQELLQTRELLSKKGVPVDQSIQLGVMVEVPSVALLTEQFASEVDFFSIGTNDLTQYTLAVDRGNSLISSLYQPLHPSVLMLIDNTVKAGETSGKPVAVCGEVSADPFSALVLMGLGITELSLTPRLIPRVKQALRVHTLNEMQALATALRKSNSAEESRLIREDWSKAYAKKLKQQRIQAIS